MTETDRAHVEKLMDEMLEKLLLERRNAARRERTPREDSKSRPYAICFFRTGEAVRFCGSGTRGSYREVAAESIRNTLLPRRDEADVAQEARRQDAPRRCADSGKNFYQGKRGSADESIDMRTGVKTSRDIPSRLMFPAWAARMTCVIAGRPPQLATSTRRLLERAVCAAAASETLRAGPDLRELRGNVDTQLRK